MQNSQNLEPILTTLVTGEEDEVFEALLTLFPNDKTGSIPALTDCLAAYGEGMADVFNRFAARFPDDVARAEFLISAAMQTQKLGTPELSNALLTAAELKVQGIDENAELEWARRLTKLGNEHYRSARYAMAEPLYDQALSIHRRVLGADHPDTAESLNNLAVLYRVQERHAEAAPLLKKAVEIMERVLGAEHPNTKIMRENYEGLLADINEKGR